MYVQVVQTGTQDKIYVHMYTEIFNCTQPSGYTYMLYTTTTTTVHTHTQCSITTL